MHDECASSNFSSPPPSIASSLEGINISETDEEVEQQPENTTLPLPESIPLTPILQDIQDSRYENIPSLSAIPSLPSTPNTPIAPTRPVKRVTRSKQPKVSTTKRRKKAKKLLLDYKWKKTSFRHGASIEAEENDFVDSSDEHASPLDYFYMFFSPNILTDIVDQTNFYSVQEIGRPIQLTVDELKDFISIHLLMGIVQMPSYLDYWSTKFHYGKVADIMPLKRYQQIRRWLHFANNNLDDGDRYHKARPVLEQIRRNCLKQQGRETQYSIDEMMIAYKGTKAGKRKQYMKDKPNKWGFKNYVRAGVSGIIYDFLLYAGEDTFRYHTFSEEEESLGFGAQVVIALCQSIDRKPAIIYCDNFFSSPELFYVLREKYGIFGLGTIRNNRIRGAEKVLPDEKAFKKKPRGHFAEVSCDKNRLAVVRWNDNKIVTFISSFVASEPVEKIVRYSKEEKKKVEVECPQIVRQYNKHMGGVDLADMLVSLYKTPFKTKRWYMVIFAQMLDICINNAWLVHRKKNGSSRKIPLKAFRYAVYENLLNENRCAQRTRKTSPKVVKPRVARPSSPVKFDNVGHFPSTMEEGRCRFCQMKTVVFCIKCQSRLCFVTGKNARNCFLDFHTK